MITKKPRQRTKRVIVRCPICKETLYTLGNSGFRHCDGMHSIDANLYNQGKIKITKDQDINQEAEVLGGSSSDKKAVDSQAEQTASPSTAPLDNKLNIEEPEPDPEVPEEYRCPFCKSTVEIYQDCINPECLAEITWKR